MLSIWVDKSSLFFEISILFIALMILILITLIFWDAEHALHLIYNTDIIGLNIGLYVKYQLDKKYGFVNSFTEAAS